MVIVSPKTKLIQNNEINGDKYTTLPTIAVFFAYFIANIKNIKVISLKEADIEQKDFPLSKYKLINQDVKNFLPDENQKILEISRREIFIEESIKNKFLFIQKILSYGQDCVVLEPMELREEIIDAIKGILSFYE